MRQVFPTVWFVIHIVASFVFSQLIAKVFLLRWKNADVPELLMEPKVIPFQNFAFSPSVSLQF